MVEYFVWDEPYLWKHYLDQLIRMCILENEFHSRLTFCHSYACGGHFKAKMTALKVLESRFYWQIIFKDVFFFCKSCDRCQRIGTLGARNQMTQTPILFVEIFYVWDIDLMGLSLHLMVIFTSFLSLIMCQNGWKQGPLELMILKWL